MEVWVVDTDGGVDDAQAVVLALKEGGLRVVGITTVAGNVDLEQATRNVQECVRVCGRSDVPIFKGASRPMISPFRPAADHIHGKDGLGNYWDSHEPTNLPPPQSQNAVMEILRLANEYNKRLNIVTLGPLTNLGLALCVDEHLAEKLNRVVVMGGAPTGIGNVTISAEFNIWSDPEAAHIVFERIPQIELITWELCIDPKHSFSEEWKSLYLSQTSTTGQFISSICAHNRDVVYCDPIAVAVAIDPTIVQTHINKEGWVELSGSLTRGMTIINWEGSDLITVNVSSRRNLLIATGLNMQKLQGLLLESVRN